jgi:hypothetical protein
MSAAAKTPARTAKKAALKAVPTPVARKLRWTVVDGERGQKGGTEQTATAGDHEYRIAKVGDAWQSSVTVDGTTTVLLPEGTYSRAYASVVAHNRNR